MPRTSAPLKVRFKLLDGLRLFAALSVVAYHYLGYQHEYWGIPVSEQFPRLSQFAAYGGLGVHLFFIISGFVILMSAWGRSIPQFVASRVSRLYPAYWAAVLATTFLLVVITQGSMKKLSFEQVFMNLTMVQGAFGVGSVDGVYWTLFVELLFYGLVTILITRNPTEGKVRAFVLLWPIVGVIAARTDSALLTYFLVPQYAPLFAGGMAIFLIHKFGHSLARWLLVVFNAFAAAQQATVGFFKNDMIPDTGQDLSTTACITIILVMFTTVAIVTISPVKGWGPNWLTYAGALTYPVYLVHENWGWWIISWANPILGKWAALVLAVGFSLVVAALIERFVERPLQPIIKRALLRDQPRHAPAYTESKFSRTGH